MTDRRSAGMSEFTWYSRLAAWIGAAMLLVQSILGRDAGPVSVLAVLLLGIGFLCFLIGLAVDSRVPGAALLMGPALREQDPVEVSEQAPNRAMPMQPAIDLPPAAAIPTRTPEPRKQDKPPKRSAPSTDTRPAVSGPARRPKFRERAKKTDTRPAPEPQVVAEAVQPAERVPEQPAPVSIPLSQGVETEVLSPASVAVGSECPRCGSSLRVGQLAAGCPVCGRTHHAICWMENHFHCGAPDCSGHGSLEAPSTSDASDQAPSG